MKPDDFSKMPRIDGKRETARLSPASEICNPGCKNDGSAARAIDMHKGRSPVRNSTL